HLLADRPGHDDAAFGCAAGVLDGIAVHEEAGAAKHLVAGVGRQAQHEWAVRPVCVDVFRRADGVGSLRDRADFYLILLVGIILAIAGAGITVGGHIAIAIEQRSA